MGRISRASLFLPLLAGVLGPVAASDLVWENVEKPLTEEEHQFDRNACPDYAHYAAYPQ